MHAKLQEQELQKLTETKRMEEEQEEREIYESILLLINQQEMEVRDSKNRRWFRCEWCDRVAPEAEFVRYGGPGKKNIGTCRTCREKSHVQLKKQSIDNESRRKSNDSYCPECGGKLLEKKGIYGNFVGCQNYPKCRYSRKIKKRRELK